MTDKAEVFGVLVSTYGRFDTRSRQLIQAIVLGVVIALFIAPAFGFPMLSRGSNFLGFAVAVLVTAVVLSLVMKKLRRNRAVLCYERGVLVANGSETTRILFSDIHSVSYQSALQELIFVTTHNEEVRLRIDRGLGVGAVRAIQRLGGYTSSGPETKSTPA